MRARLAEGIKKEEGCCFRRRGGGRRRRERGRRQAYPMHTTLRPEESTREWEDPRIWRSSFVSTGDSKWMSPSSLPPFPYLPKYLWASIIAIHDITWSVLDEDMNSRVLVPLKSAYRQLCGIDTGKKGSCWKEGEPTHNFRRTSKPRE